MANANEMAILQLVDRCVRCNGCVISCKRTWHMKGIVPTTDTGWDAAVPDQKLAPNQRVVIKSQKRVDMGPFVRFSCWHCEDAPCQGRCPFKAIKKHPVTGAVYIDPTLCKPGEKNSAGVPCVHQCKIDCQRGGVPMIGDGSYAVDALGSQYGTKAWKCTLCTGVDELGNQFGPYKGAGLGGDLPTKASAAEIAAVPEKAHQPACVYTCPAKAMVYDTRANILTYLNTGKYPGGFQADATWMSRFGDGSMFWASEKYVVAPPKADPFVEDHLSPMVSSLLSSPFAKAALAPTLVAGAVLAIAARRAKMEEEVSMTGEER